VRVAVYAGTFDPITLGHASVIERAARLFDRLLIVVAVNPHKQPLLSVTDRLELIAAVTRPWANVTAAFTEGYVVSFAREQGARYLVRGVRGATDIDSEIALANLNYGLAPEIETVFVPAHPELSEVSSSKLKELCASGGDLARYCAPEVAERLRRRLSARGEDAWLLSKSS
jgi:pantetheine-phosphate adenylyltransferase